MKLNHKKMEFKIFNSSDKITEFSYTEYKIYYFEILSVDGAIMVQGSIMLFSTSDSHQYTAQTACMWKFSVFILVLHRLLYVVLLL